MANKLPMNRNQSLPMQAESPNYRRWHPLLFLGLTIGFALRLVIAWQPVEEISWRVLADDAFYYFKLAQNIGMGHGATFDGIHPTNGFHPVYTALLIPIFWIAGDNLSLGVHLALTLVILFNIATAFPIYLIGKLIASRRAGIIGALISVLNPWSAILTMTGVESAVYVFFFAWTVVAYLYWRDSPSVQRSLIVGITLGITIMARSEGGMLLLGIVVDMLIYHRQRMLQALQDVVPLGIATLLVCIPWAIWSTLQSNTPFQISSAAIMLHSHAEQPSSSIDIVKWYLARTSWFIPRFGYKILLFNIPTVLLVTGVFSLMVMYHRNHLYQSWQSTRPVRFLFIPFVLISGYYNLILWHQQHWYFNGLVLIITIIALPMIGYWLDIYEKQIGWAMGGIGMACLILISITTVVLTYVQGLYPAQKPNYAVGQWISTSSVQTALIGATDSGITGFFCRCTMVNLDGVMNNSAYEYYKMHGYSKNSIGLYLVNQNIPYLVTTKGLQPDAFGDSVWLHPEYTVGDTGISLYQVTTHANIRSTEH